MSAAVLTGLGLINAGCESTLQDQKITMKQDSKQPVHVATYDYQGQKVDQLKLEKITIQADKKISEAIDINYGQNQVIHDNNPLIAYQNLTNYADRYDQIISNNAGFDVYGNQIKPDDKSEPVAGEIYGMFKKELPQNGNVLIVKTRSGAPIGIFAGKAIKLADFGDSDDSDAIVNIDHDRVFIFNAAYTIYPISAMQSMWTKSKATEKRHQAKVATKQVTPKVDDGAKKRK